MYKIEKHPILEIPPGKEAKFFFHNQIITAQRGQTIAAALHQAGFPVHSHQKEGRERSMQCGIGKCGACEMLVDGKIKRICITKVDGVQQVQEIPTNYLPEIFTLQQEKIKVYKTEVAIVGAGPAGLACREELNKWKIPNLVIDNNDKVGGQFNMQTHQFFFFEQEKTYGGQRGFDIASQLAGEDHSGILLNSTVWDIFDNRRIAVKNLQNNTLFYIDARYIVIATGALPFMPPFENDDLPGVYTAAVVQKMMNVEHTLLGKRILSIGAGNIGYLTSYQATQAGAKVIAIIEGMNHEGGFPVQANRVRRLGIPILTSHILLKAIPNKTRTGIIGAVVAECKDFQPIPGTEKIIHDIDLINVCTGLLPDDQLLRKSRIVYGHNAYGVGDAIRVGEGTCAVLRGKQAAMEIAMAMRKPIPYNNYLTISRAYIDSQQHPIPILKEPYKPSADRMQQKGFVIADCLYGFACNPCSFSCPQNAITKSATSSVPIIDYEKCIGCMDCVTHCPGLAIFGYNLSKNWLFLPIENFANEGESVFLVNNQGEKIGKGIIEKITYKENKTHLARVKALDIEGETLTMVRGFITQSQYPELLHITPAQEEEKGHTYLCHCENIELDQLLNTIGNRKMISVDVLKHTTRIGMGPCRGSRCIPRIKQALRKYGIEVVGEATPRGPLSNQILMGELYPTQEKVETIMPFHKKREKIECEILVAGGGIAGSSLFRYFTEKGKNCVLINMGRGSSWRNIAGGRPAFSIPEIADIARNNRQIFKDLQSKTNINYQDIRYVGLAHNEDTYRSLEASISWSDAYMVDRKDFQKEISPYFNKELNTYQAALITKECWQATPGLVLHALRNLGLACGGKVYEQCELLEVERNGSKFIAIARTNDGEFIEVHCEHFANALGYNAERFAKALGISTGLYPVKHQAFITKPLPLMGIDGKALDMVIDRRNYKGFSAVYGQQLEETGQIIGCASPSCDFIETNQELRNSSQSFLEIAAEVFIDWLPILKGISLQATWSGYYTEPRYIVDPDNGLLVGLRGHGFMLGQYLAKLYVDKYLGLPVPEYMNRLLLTGDGLSENNFK